MVAALVYRLSLRLVSNENDLQGSAFHDQPYPAQPRTVVPSPVHSYLGTANRALLWPITLSSGQSLPLPYRYGDDIREPSGKDRERRQRGRRVIIDDCGDLKIRDEGGGMVAA
ncbi:hypothetical protein ACFE04_024756 [Oxalis oulophora]